MPNGQSGPVNQRAVDYYRSALDLLQDAGVIPFVSLHQWDYPCTIEVQVYCNAISFLYFGFTNQNCSVEVHYPENISAQC